MPVIRFASHDYRYALIGPLLWASSIQYFIVQIVAAHAWHTSYNLMQNPISDLGNTSCAEYRKRMVCSPQHGFMNFSFVVLGLTMAVGAVLVCRLFERTNARSLGFALLMLAGAGTMLVGLFPENTVSSLHILGAALPFLLGNIGLILLGLVLPLPRFLRWLSIFFGSMALLALVFFMTNQYLGLGIGGMERIVAYPQTIWLIVIGFYLLRNRKV